MTQEETEDKEKGQKAIKKEERAKDGTDSKEDRDRERKEEEAEVER